jgi:hypothetical protein
MHEAHKIVPIDGHSYRLGRLTAAVGGYIWQRLLAAIYKARETAKPEQEPTKEDEAKPKPPVEDRMRTICGMTFMFLSFEDYQFVQRHCMAVVARKEPDPAGYLDIQLTDGRWAVPEIESNPFLVTKLMTEVLVWNLAPFLD